MKTKAKTSAKKPFLTDVKELRRRARKHIEKGAVTGATGSTATWSSGC